MQTRLLRLEIDQNLSSPRSFLPLLPLLFFGPIRPCFRRLTDICVAMLIHPLPSSKVEMIEAIKESLEENKAVSITQLLLPSRPLFSFLRVERARFHRHTLTRCARKAGSELDGPILHPSELSCTPWLPSELTSTDAGRK